MVHISQCHAMITILFNISITTFDTFHQHNFPIPQPQSMMLPIHITFQYPVKYQLYISTTTITFYNTLSNTNYISLPQLSLSVDMAYLHRCPSLTPIYLTGPTTTRQDNNIYIYIMYQILLYHSNRVLKAPDSLFCIKVTFKGFEG